MRTRPPIKMLRVLFDKNVPYPLRNYLTDCQVKTAEEEGWGQLSNGELIARTEKAGYQIFLTCDQNLRYQQNLTHRSISMIVLGSNILPSIQSKIPDVVAAVQRASPGSFEFIEIPPPAKRRRLPAR